MNMLKRFLANANGATSIEYALVASLIGMVIIAAVTSIGGSLGGTFTTVAGAF
ncbi:hypothetical protein U91I_01680 [alpha proteobacterium U9-1i]|nr:hypothetical protein U91I_01680 [alpha proteobacterium U9-1i]